MRIDFRPGKPAGDIFADWWQGLQHDPGARARLRRCRSPAEVMLEPGFHRLLNRFATLAARNGDTLGEGDIGRLAAIAGLLAHVSTPASKSLAEQMAEPKAGRPVLSPLRFRRLLKEPFEDFFPAMVRVIRLLDKKANVRDLAESVFYWGDKVRRRWALAYFPKVVD